jgi:3-hydroxyisobutyrate dehydrogenase-like beta-hydroxyacid dehydrogenase
MRVGFVGLGDQGAPMAQALAESGWAVHLWARRPETLAALVGAFPFTAAATVAELGRACEVVGICVDRDRDVEELLVDRGLLASLLPGAVVVNHGTGAPAEAQRFAALGQAAGIEVLDAPVSGGGDGARARSLTVMVGGDAVAYQRCRALFDCFGRDVHHLGGPGAGQLAKLVNNLLLTMNLRSAEAVLEIADALGLDVGRLAEVLLASSGASTALRQLARTAPDLLAHYRGMLAKDVDALGATAADRGIAAGEAVDAARRGIDGIPAALRLLGRPGDHGR